MICTDTDHYVNTLSTIKKERKKKEVNKGIERLPVIKIVAIDSIPTAFEIVTKRLIF